MSGRHVLIAGGGRGIGAACAARFRQRGDRVSILSRTSGIAVDLRDAEAAAAAVARAEFLEGGVDVLVCTAGAAQQAPLADLNATALRAGMDAKYFPYANVMMATLPGMISRGRGVIIPVIGMGGKRASPTHLPGGAANAALMLLTTGLGHAYAAQGVRVVGVNPGPVMTERLERLIAAHALQDGLSHHEAHTRISANIPNGRLPGPDDIAALVCLLADPAADIVNGTVLAADGGATPVI